MHFSQEFVFLRATQKGITNKVVKWSILTKSAHGGEEEGESDNWLPPIYRFSFEVLFSFVSVFNQRRWRAAQSILPANGTSCLSPFKKRFHPKTKCMVSFKSLSVLQGGGGKVFSRPPLTGQKGPQGGRPWVSQAPHSTPTGRDIIFRPNSS